MHIFSVHLADTANFHIVSDGCSGKTLLGSQSCDIVVNFKPSRKGHYKGDLSVLNTGLDVVDYASLAGEGTAPEVTLSSSSLNFGDQTINRSSSPQTVTVTNSGTATLNISSISPTGDFSVSNDCGDPVAPGGTCSIDVVFTPTSVGFLIGDVKISDDAAGSPQIISLKGKGIPPVPLTPDASLSATSLNFGNQVVNTSSDPEQVILSNVGTGTLTIADISPSGDFSVSDSCGATLAPNQHCTIDVTFNPLSTGVLQGTLSVTDDASDSPQKVELQGKGIVPDTPFVTLSTSGMDFGEQTVRTTGAPQSLVLANTGTSDLTCGTSIIEGDGRQSFSLSDHCHGSVIPINGTCTIDVSFRPVSEGPLNATIKITNDASDSPQYVTLTGLGVGHRGYGIYFTTNETSVSPGETLAVSWSITGVIDIVDVYFGAILPDDTVYTMNHHLKWKRGAVPILQDFYPGWEVSGTLNVVIPTSAPPGDYYLFAALQDACGLKYPGVVFRPLNVR